MRDASEAVPDGAHPSCVHAAACPGCPWIGQSYEVQLQAKTARVARTTSAFPNLVRLDVKAAQRAPSPLQYRVRAKLVADASGALGLFARGTHDVVDTPHCEVLDPLVAEGVAAVRACLRELAVLDGVDVARVGDALLVTLIAASDADPARVTDLAERVRSACPAIKSLAVSHRARGAVQLLGGELRVFSGPSELPRRLDPEGPYHYATHGAFVQAYPEVARAMYGRIAERALRVGARPRVLELYAGSGALSLALAARGAEVVSVEAFTPAVERLARAAREQALAIDVRAADAAIEAQRLAREGARFDVVLVNPPRRGLDLEVRRALVELSPIHVGYVACHPPTLARDLAHLAREGLVTEVLEPFDMMPLTEHVETLAWLTRGARGDADVLCERGPLLAVNKAPHEPTTPQGEHANSLLSRVQRLKGFEQAAPLHRLDVGTSGVCLFARSPGDVAPLAAALSEAKKTYIALAHGIARSSGRITKPLSEQGRVLDARTQYRRREVVLGHSLLDVVIDTGRKHQIRRHLASIGHPVVGDARYGDRRGNLHFAMRHGLDRPFLHCASLELSLGGEMVRLDAPLAPDLELVLESMRSEALVRRQDLALERRDLRALAVGRSG